MDSASQPSDLDDFRKALVRVPWFSAIGEPTDHEYTIPDWDGWPGPDDPSVMLIGSWQQELHDGILDSAGDDLDELQAFWLEIRGSVLEAASARVPFDAEQDAWHGPTSAAWFAAWTGALVALHLKCQLRLPRDLATQWAWFSRGRWPCAYAYRTDEDTERLDRWYRDGPPPEGLVKVMEDRPNEFVIL